MDDDGAASRSPSVSPSPSPSPPPSPLAVAEPVTVAAPPAGGVLTLALPIPSHTLRHHSSPSGAGAGREDAWSEGATSALIDAWGERFVALGRGSLRHPQWQEVADAVSSRDGFSKPPKSDVQCKNRIDTLKKKYKIEKAKPSSSWPFFRRLDALLGPVYKSIPSSTNPNPGPGIPPFPKRLRTPLLQSGLGSGSGVKRSRLFSPQPDASSESSDGFPPEPPAAMNGKRKKVGVAVGEESDKVAGLRELAQAIRRLGEVYERVEQSRAEQAAAAEHRRMDFIRELDMQRAQFFMKAQAELSQVKGLHHGQGQGRAGDYGGRRPVPSRTDDAAGTSGGGGLHGRMLPNHKYHSNNAGSAEANVGSGASADTDEEDDEE